MKILLIILIFICGIIFITFGTKFYLAMSQFKKTSITATGKVIDMTTNKSKTGGLVYSPVVIFTTEKGEQIKYSAQRYRNEKYTIGDDIKVLYNKDNPNQAYLDTKASIFGGAYFLLLAGIACIVFSVLLYI